LWFDIGNFEPQMSEISAQRLETWGTKWSGEATLEAAKGEAMRESLNDRVRALAQAESLINILNSLGKLGPTAKSSENIRNLIVLRTAQILETMVEASRVETREDVPDQPPSIAKRRFKLEG